jgi:putative nucleotidyltransferase with HDIG domain
MVTDTDAADQELAEEISEPPGVAAATKRVLIVDDEPHLLESLKDALRPYRRAWRVEFASGGEAALEALEQEPADVVIADMQMPGMDGATLLAHVCHSYPETIRMILSGHPDPRVLARTATVAHGFFGKPCNVQELGMMIERSCELREMSRQAEAYRATAAATTLPSRPGLYTELLQVTADPSWGPAQVAEVVERDTAVTAKVLQLANSAFFGVGRTVSSVREAVVYLGADTIESLTLTVEAFGKLTLRQVEGFSIEEFQQHAVLVASITSSILPAGRTQSEALTAALLHDIGKLVLIADDPGRWARLTTEARMRGLPLHEVELRREGVTHAATGAYLLSLWGLPDGVVEAVAHHHDPGSVPGFVLDARVAVHIADALANELRPSGAGGPPPGTLDEEFLDRLGLRRQQDLWRHAAAKSASQLAGASRG